MFQNKYKGNSIIFFFMHYYKDQLYLFGCSSGCSIGDGPCCFFSCFKLCLAKDLHQHWNNIGINYRLCKNREQYTREHSFPHLNVVNLRQRLWRGRGSPYRWPYFIIWSMGKGMRKCYRLVFRYLKEPLMTFGTDASKPGFHCDMSTITSKNISTYPSKEWIISLFLWVSLSLCLCHSETQAKWLINLQVFSVYYWSEMLKQNTADYLYFRHMKEVPHFPWMV